MSDTKEPLELAARAMGIKVIESEFYPGELWMVHPDDPRFLGCRWNPRANSGDCAEMCAALGIATTWTPILVCVELKGRLESEYFKDHNNDRAAAWRMAALRVAIEIGRAL